MDSNPDSSNLSQTAVEKEREVALCLSALRSKKPETRARAIKRLGELRSAVDEIVAALDDRNGIVRAAAAEGLGHLDEDTLTPDIIERLLSAIDDPFDRVCSYAISSLGRLRVEMAREQIVPFLEDRNSFVVDAAIIALTRLGPPEIGEKLVGLDSENSYLQSAAVYAMGSLPYPPAGPRLLEILQEILNSSAKPNPSLLGNLIKALGTLQVRDAIPLLVEVAQSQVGYRTRAVQALLELNAVEAAPILAPMLSDPGLRIRENLIRLLDSANYVATPILLRPLLEDPNVPIRHSALMVLARLQDAPSLKTIRRMSRQDSNPFIRVSALSYLCTWLGEEAIADLVGLVQDTNVEIRKMVAENLGRLESLTPEGLAALHTLAADPVPEVVQAAQEALLEHPGSPGDQPVLLPQPAHHTLPANMQPEAEILRAQLQKWQDGLPRLSAPGNLTELAAIDQALTLLIEQLERP
jgi:HEAT repeat protein